MASSGGVRQDYMIKPRWLCLAGLAVVVRASILSSPAQESPVVHDPRVHSGAGLKKELIEGITEADFLRLGDQPKSIKVTLVSAFTETNSGMNFNGYAHGQASYLIPVGWTVEVTLINPSPVPHSAIVVDRELLRKVRMDEAAFEGASTPSPHTGMSTSKATFSFIARTAGKYAFACGIPTHAMTGHWIALEVSAAAKVPTLSLGDKTPIAASNKPPSPPR